MPHLGGLKAFHRNGARRIRSFAAEAAADPVGIEDPV
jgi:hypothetical protein